MGTSIQFCSVKLWSSGNEDVEKTEHVAIVENVLSSYTAVFVLQWDLFKHLMKQHVDLRDQFLSVAASP